MANVVCDETWLKGLKYGHCTDISWQTQWGHSDSNAGGGGCWSASWTMPRLPKNYTYPCLRRGADVRIKIGGVSVFAGKLDGIDRDTNRVTAKGYVQYAKNRTALELDGGGQLVPSSIPNKAIDRAIGPSWNVARLDNFPPTGDTAYVHRVLNLDIGVMTTSTQTLNTVDALLTQAAIASGMRWGIDADAVIFAAADKAEPDYILVPSFPVPGVTDSDFLTTLHGRYSYGYVAAVFNATTGALMKNGYLLYATASVSDADSIELTGEEREAPVDLTPLGPITGELILAADAHLPPETVAPGAVATAKENLAGRLKLGGARAGWTSPMQPQGYQLLTRGGRPAPLWRVKAGDVVRISRVLTIAGQMDTGGRRDVVVSATDYTDGASVIQLDPMGMQSRDLGSLLTVAAARPLPVDVVGGPTNWFTA